MREGIGVLLAKIESSYGVDPTPGAADAILVSGVKIEPQGEMRERKVVLPYVGSLASIPVGTGIKISFSKEVYGSGAATTPPKHGPLLRAMGFTQTIGGSDVSYDENSSQDCESACLYFYEDGILYKALGCVGENLKMGLEANNIGSMEFSFQGLFGGQAAMVTDTSVITPTFGTLQTPPVFRNASLAIDGYSAVASKLEATIANELIRRGDANSAYGMKRFSIKGRKITGSLDPEMPALSAYNPWSTWESGATGALTATLGSGAGNRLVLSAPAVQKEMPKIGARDGMRTYDLSWEARVTTSAGNNRLQFRFN